MCTGCVQGACGVHVGCVWQCCRGGSGIARLGVELSGSQLHHLASLYLVVPSCLLRSLRGLNGGRVGRWPERQGRCGPGGPHRARSVHMALPSCVCTEEEPCLHADAPRTRVRGVPAVFPGLPPQGRGCVGRPLPAGWVVLAGTTAACPLRPACGDRGWRARGRAFPLPSG